MRVILITGGVRSGKSAFSEKLASQLNGSVLYVATGIAADVEMEQRIRLHQTRRSSNWGLLEVPFRLVDSVDVYEKYEIVLIDCLSSWIGNRLFENEKVGQQLVDEIRIWLEKIRSLAGTVILVSSEVGLGGVAMSHLGRLFQDILGEVNQVVANQAHEVYAVWSGIPWRIKG